MTQYEKVNVKLFDTPLKKKSSYTNQTEATLIMTRKMLEIDVPNEIY